MKRLELMEKQEEDEKRKRRVEEEVILKKAKEDASRRRAEEEFLLQKAKEEAEAAARKKEEEELKKKAIEEYNAKQAEEAAKKKKADEEAEKLVKERMWHTLHNNGYTDAEIEDILKRGDKKNDKHGKAHSHSPAPHVHHVHESSSTVLTLTRPTFIKVNRKHLDPYTLDLYELPWEWDEVSPPLYVQLHLSFAQRWRLTSSVSAARLQLHHHQAMDPRA